MDNFEKYRNSFIEISDLELDILVVISKNFYYGPANSATEVQFDTLREDLYQPKFQFYRTADGHNYALGTEVYKKFDEYKKYVLDVYDQYLKHDKPIDGYPYYFWVYPILHSPSQSIEINFQWTDTFSYAALFYELITKDKEGILYSDLEQGWQVEAMKVNDQFLVYEDDFDDGNLVAAIKTDYQQILTKAPPILKMIHELKSELTKLIPAKYKDSFKF